MDNQNAYSLTAIRAKRMAKQASKRGYVLGDNKSPFHSFRLPQNEIDTRGLINYFFLWKSKAILD